jgi:hypothetical protein
MADIPTIVEGESGIEGPGEQRPIAKPTSANITSRRSAMKIGAAALLAASSVAAATAPTPVVDPIYAGMERHRKAWAELGRTLRASDAAMEAIGWKDDAPAWTAEGRAQAAAEVEITASMIELAQTQPTTAAGIATVLAYARGMRIDGEELFAPDDSAHSLGTWLLTLERAATALTSV